MGQAEDRAKRMEDKVETFQAMVGKFQGMMTNCLKTENTITEAYLSLASILREMASMETYDEMVKALESTSRALTEIETNRQNVVIGRLQHTVVDRLDDINEFCVKPARLLLNDRNQAVKKMHKTQGALVKVQASKTASETRIEAKKEQLEDEIVRVQNIDETLEDTVLKYEEKRLTECKAALEDLLRSQLFLHCKAIESLSEAIVRIRNVNEEDGVNTLATELRLENPNKENKTTEDEAKKQGKKTTLFA